jgi:hypothetical protein
MVRLLIRDLVGPCALSDYRGRGVNASKVVLGETFAVDKVVGTIREWLACKSVDISGREVREADTSEAEGACNVETVEGYENPSRPNFGPERLLERVHPLALWPQTNARCLNPP